MRIPFLHNVRRGLATNSSSSHSLVYMTIAEVDGPTVQPLERTLNEAEWTDTEFGWDGPTLDTLGSKLMYALTDRIGNNWKDLTEAELATAKENYGHLFPEFEGRDDLWQKAANGYVDHQSAGTASDMDAIRDPRTAIFIDNDNH